MPQAIPAIILAVKTAATAASMYAASVGVTITAGQILGAVAGVAAAAAATAFTAMQPQVPSSSSAIEWTADPNAPNRFPFGRIGGAGNIIHNATYGPNKMYVGFVGVMASSGPINAWVGFKADGLSPTFNGAGMATTTEYANEMWLARQVGSQPSASALASPAGLKYGATIPDWGASYKLSGKAAYMYTLSENSKRSAYGGKVPTGIHTIEGLLCYDPRLDSTYPGGSGSCRLNNPATWVYTTNAYLHALSWTIGRWEGLTAGAYGAPYASMKVGGIGARPDGIDFAAYVEAANVFEENEWACAAWPDADQSKAGVLDSFLQAGGGIYAERQGRVSCLHRAAPRTSVVTITADDTAGTIEYDTTTSLLDRINTIRPEHWSEAHDWQVVATDEVTSSVWREEDGQGVEVTRSKGLAYNYVPGSKQARELAALQIAHTREGIRGTVPVRRYLDLDVGDCFDFDVPEAVLNGQKCIVLNAEPDLEADVLNITFCSETDGKYPFAYGQTDQPPPTAAIVPYAPAVDTPDASEWALTAATLTGDDGAEIPALSLVGVVDNARATAVIFEYRRNGDTAWLSAGTESPDVENKLIAGLAPGSWQAAVSYRVDLRTSDRLILGPVTLASITIPLTPDVLDDADVIRGPSGDGGGTFVGDFDATNDTTVDQLETDLLAGTVKPAEAVSFTGKGALAVLDLADTAQITPNAVSNRVQAYTAATLALSGTSAVTIQTATYTTTGGPMEVRANFFMNIYHPAGGGVSARIRIVQASPFGGNLFDETFPAIGDDFLQGWQTPTVNITRAAGAYTFEVIVSLSVGTSAVETVQARLLSVEEAKR